MKNPEIKEKDCAPVPKEQGSWFCEVENIQDVVGFEETIEMKLKRLTYVVGVGYERLDMERKILAKMEQEHKASLEELKEVILSEYGLSNKIAPFIPSTPLKD